MSCHSLGGKSRAARLDARRESPRRTRTIDIPLDLLGRLCQPVLDAFTVSAFSLAVSVKLEELEDTNFVFGQASSLTNQTLEARANH